MINSFKYAFSGILYAFKSEINFRLHILSLLIVIILGFIFHISKFEWIAVLLVSSLVIVLELLNTAIEYLVDLIDNKYNLKIKIIKDTAAAAVLVAAVNAFITGIIIFFPKIITVF